VAVLVVLLGLAIVCFGLAGLSAPQRIIDGMLNWQPVSRFYFAVGSRLVFGTVLLLAASDCRFSTVILALGVVGLVAALVLAPLGPRRVDSMLQWWLERPPVVLRAWFAAAIPFGAFLAYAGI
jgi:hypothetical protein